MSLPYTIQSGDPAEAAPVQGNFESLDTRLAAVETEVDNISINAALYDNGVFTGGLTASQVGTTLVYTTGGLIVNSTYYAKSTLIVDFNGESSGTYYVEVSADGTVSIESSTSSSRTNLNTVDWSGAGFNSVTTADRNILYRDANFIVAAGKSGGQTLYGSTDASEHLIIESTSDSTKGSVKIRDAAIKHKNTVQTAATTLTLDESHQQVEADATSNDITITVPAAASYLGKSYFIYCSADGSATYDVTLNRSGSDVFINEGVATYTAIVLEQYDFVEIRAVNSGEWLIVKHYGAALS